MVAASFVVTSTLGETFWSFGVFFKPLEDEFGWSRTLVSSGYVAFQLGYAISAVASGRLVDRYNPRLILLGSAVLAGLGISLCSRVTEIGQLRLFLLVGGLGSGATWSVPSSVVQRWFYGRHRAGLALGIVTTGVGAGALVFAPLINYLILSYGWRNAYLVVGILFFSIIALSSFVIKRSPIGTGTDLRVKEGIQVSTSVPDWSTGKAVITVSFVGITLSACAAVLAFQVVSVHLAPYATDVGITPTVAAAALGLMGGFSVPGRILSGFVSDRIGWQKTQALSLLGLAVSIIWLIFMRAPWMLYTFAFLYGICHGSRVTTWVGILSQFFGMRSLGELIGLSSGIGQAVAAFAPYMAGFVFDATGSYLIAFIIVMVLLLGAALVAAMIKPPPISQNS